jgi:hypothetical protein
MQVFLLRRSDLRPQRMMGVVGQKWRTSGYHYCMIVSIITLASKGLTRVYLVHNVLQGIRAINRKANK